MSGSNPAGTARVLDHLERSPLVPLVMYTDVSVMFLSGMMVNAIGHPFYSLYLWTTPSLQSYLSETYGVSSTWYFPGLFTSFLHTIIVLAMIVQLRRDYSSSAGAPTPSGSPLTGLLPRLRSPTAQADTLGPPGSVE